MLHGVQDIIREERKLLLHVLFLKISLRIFLRFRTLQLYLCVRQRRKSADANIRKESLFISELLGH